MGVLMGDGAAVQCRGSRYLIGALGWRIHRPIFPVHPRQHLQRQAGVGIRGLAHDTHQMRLAHGLGGLDTIAKLSEFAPALFCAFLHPTVIGGLGDAKEDGRSTRRVAALDEVHHDVDERGSQLERSPTPVAMVRRDALAARPLFIRFPDEGPAPTVWSSARAGRFVPHQLRLGLWCRLGARGEV